MQLGAKRAVDARATLLLGRGWCKTQNAHEARPRPSFRGQKAVSHVVWTQIPSTVLPPGQMAKCENCDSVHWQRQQSSVQVREPETGVEKVKRKWLQRTGPQVYWQIQHRAGPQICSLLASYREIAHNAENGSYSLVYCCKYNCLLGIALPQKTFLKRFYKPKKPFEKSLRAPMEDQGTKDGTVTGSKADQKKIQPSDLFWRPKFAAILASSNRPLSVLTCGCRPYSTT